MGWNRKSMGSFQQFVGCVKYGYFRRLIRKYLYMRRICLFLVSLLGSVSIYAQCDLSLVDTTHVLCYGQNTGSVSFLVTVPTASYSLSLSNGQVQYDNPVFVNLPADDYVATLSDGATCTVVLPFKIKEPAPLVLNLQCEGVSLVAEVSGGVEDYNYTWSDESGQGFSNDSEVLFEEGVMYALHVEDANACVKRDTVHLWAEFVVDSLVGSIPFEVNVSNASAQGVYNWDFGGDGMYDTPSPSHTFDEVGEYEIALLVLDASSGCEAEASLLVDAQGFELEVDDWAEMYNVFSPNGDGVNEVFAFLDNHAIVEFSARIYNRWGKKIYDWTDPKQGWDGRNVGGTIMSEGVYFYVLKAVGENGKEYEKKGTVTLFLGGK